VDVVALRKRGGIDLHDRADHDEVPVGTELRHPTEELDVHALIDDAEESEAGMRDGRLIRRLGLERTGLHEMIELDRGRESVHAVVPIALGLVEAHAAGEDEIGTGEQCAFQIEQFAGGAAEQRQLVHVVVDAQVALEMAREGHRHGSVVPEDARAARVGRKQVFDEFALFENHVRMIKPFGQHRHGDRDALRPLGDVQMGRDARLEDGFLDDENPELLRGSAQKMLRPLPHEIPPQMRKADEHRRSGIDSGG